MACLGTLGGDLCGARRADGRSGPRGRAPRAGIAHCDVVISLGGGSAIDAGKAIATIATNGGEPLEFLEVVGKGRTIAVPPLPFIAVPTTAGTGSEVTRNAVLGSTEHGVKASLRSPLMLPRVALVDPELTYGLPPAITAFTGLDALTQLIEPYVSARANPLVDAFCVEGIGARCRCAAPRVPRRRGPRGAPRHGAGKPVRRPGAGQRRTGRGAWLCGAARRLSGRRRTARSVRRCCRTAWRPM